MRITKDYPRLIRREDGYYYYCPNCGAKMGEEENGKSE